LVLLQQVSIGGLFAIAAAPFHELERGFFKSTASVLLVLGFLGLWGKIELYGNVIGTDKALFLALAVEVLFLVAFALYLYSLWGERIWFRARIFSFSLLVGVASLILSSFRFQLTPFWSVESLLYPLSFLLSALLLGAVTVGMLIGHWYLIDTGQSIAPLIRIFKFFVASLVAQAVFMLILPVLLIFLAGAETIEKTQLLWRDHHLLLLARVFVTQVAPLGLSYMIWRTLKIPHTMAATGLFYVAMLGVFVGEILGRQILALTAIPF
jgi:hypothetical protein